MLTSVHQWIMLCLCVAALLTPWRLNSNNPAKINGVSFVSPPKPFTADPIKPILAVNGNWVAISPFAYCKAGQPNIIYNSSRQWWGERTEGIIETIKFARKNGLFIMLKPQVWNNQEGWMGTFDLPDEASWKKWEQQYENYVLPLARVADSMQVNIFCIGTEFRIAARQRPDFWCGLIDKVRQVYSGKLTYASNWDNFHLIGFWDELDFIGIDAYFPLSSENTPAVDQLKSAWKEPYRLIDQIRKKFDRPVIFTEYGYRSINKTAGKQWELEDDWHYRGKGNHTAQFNAFKALYQVFWDQPWFAGGFIWKWYPDHHSAGGLNNTDYTPQNKPVEELIREVYQQ